MQFLPSSYNILALVCLYLLVWTAPARAQTPILLTSPDFGRIALSTSGEVHHAALSSWRDPLDLKEAKFQPLTPEILQHTNQGVTWIRFAIQNGTSEALPLTWITESLFFPAAIYQQEAGSKLTLLGGFDEGMQGRPTDARFGMPSVDLILNAGEVRSLYLKVQKNPPSHSLLFSLYDKSTAESAERQILLLKGFILGVGLIAFLYSLFVAVSLRNRVLFSYCAYALSFHLMFFVSAPVYPSLSESLWLRQWGELLLAISIECVLISATWFTVLFLDLSRQNPWLARILLAGLPFYLINMGLAFFDRSWNETIANIELLFFGVTALLAGIIRWIQGYHPARFFTIGWGILIGANTLYTFAELGMFPLSLGLEWTVYLAGSVEIFVLTLGLSYRQHMEQRQTQEQVTTLHESLQKSHQALEASYAALESRDTARTQLFHHVSHELRTPLNGILGYLRIALRGQAGSLNYELQDILSKTFSLADALKSQIFTILELAQAKRGRLSIRTQWIDLYELGSRMQQLAEGLCVLQPQASFHVLVEGGKRAKEFRGDYEKIYAILRNLVGNAIKFSAKDHFNRVQLILRIFGDTLEIDVFDTGIGIAKDRLESIFDEFERAQHAGSQQYEGAGLGLALVRTYVGLLEGHIQVYSDLGIGTHFALRIPESQQEPQIFAPSQEDDLSLLSSVRESQQTEVQRVLSAAPQLTGAKIWVVDDQADNCEVLSAVLRFHGAEAYPFQDGRALLEKLTVDQPDLILLDMMMPECSGEDCVNVMKSDPVFRTIPVIMLTARAGDGERQRLTALGADDYLCKPIQEEELVSRVRNLLDRVTAARSEGALSEHLRLMLMAEFLEASETQMLQKLGSGAPAIQRDHGWSSVLRTVAPAGGHWYSLGVKALVFKEDGIPLSSDTLAFAMPSQSQQKCLREVRQHLWSMPVSMEQKCGLWHEVLSWGTERQQALADVLNLAYQYAYLSRYAADTANLLAKLRLMCQSPRVEEECDAQDLLRNLGDLLLLRGHQEGWGVETLLAPLRWPGSSQILIPLVMSLVKTSFALLGSGSQGSRLQLVTATDRDEGLIQVKLFGHAQDLPKIQGVLWGEGLSLSAVPALGSFAHAKLLARQGGIELSFAVAEEGLTFQLRLSSSR